MKWVIKNERFDNSDLMVNIEFSPRNDALRYSLTQVRLEDYPEFIKDMSNSSSAGYELVHIRNFKDMDWEDKVWAKRIKGNDIEDGEVFLIHDVMGETIIKEMLFDKILYKFATELLKIYAGETILSNSWAIQMQNALADLKNRIDYQNSMQ